LIANRAPAGRHRWLAAGALGLLAACASLPPPAPPAGAAAVLAGRFSLAVTHTPGGALEKRENWTGRFSLVTGAAGQSLDLSSPLGATLARIESGPDGASLSVPEGGGVRTERGSDVQALSERVLGWSLPLAGLPDWVAGRPVSGRPFRVLEGDDGDAAGPTRFAQDDWTVVVARAAGGAARRVQIERPAQGESPQIELRVVLDAPDPPAAERAP
jgi:outer membrane lipoprotein LolB